MAEVEKGELVADWLMMEVERRDLIADWLKVEIERSALVADLLMVEVERSDLVADYLVKTMSFPGEDRAGSGQRMVGDERWALDMVD